MIALGPQNKGYLNFVPVDGSVFRFGEVNFTFSEIGDFRGKTGIIKILLFGPLPTPSS